MQLVPDKIGSYSSEDVIFVLRDVSAFALEKSVQDREENIQTGKQHYAEMLPVEYEPNEEYMELFHHLLQKNARDVANYTAVIAEKIVRYRGLSNIVLISLARAGTPIGILLKRYLKFAYDVNVPHYSISIVRDRGIDEQALHYILSNHPHGSCQFIDGWTGKGAITMELEAAVQKWNTQHNKKLDAYLAVLADPGYCAYFYGTNDDFLIPSACLNSTVSGLISRTVLNKEILAQDDFHGAKFYTELAAHDVSNYFLDEVESYFETLPITAIQSAVKTTNELANPSWSGLHSLQLLKETFDIDNLHHIKPGVGETTRVLLRRVPWKVLINPNAQQDLSHILHLAEDRGVPVEVFENMPYACCGLIKDLKR